MTANRAYFATLIAALALAACAALEAPQSISERLAYGYASVTAARNTAATLLEAKRIKLDDARQVQALADQARAGLDLARGASRAGDLQTAEAQLTLALSVLTQLDAYLKARAP